MWRVGWRASRVAAASTVAAAGATLATSCEPHAHISSTAHAELQKLRPHEERLRAKWEEDEAGWHKLPPRAWPPRQPKADEQTGLELAVANSCTSDIDASEACQRARFDLATCLTFNMIDPEAGLSSFRSLAAAGDVDGMVATAVVILEQIAGEITEATAAEGLELLHTAAEEHGAYERRSSLCLLVKTIIVCCR